MIFAIRLMGIASLYSSYGLLRENNFSQSGSAVSNENPSRSEQDQRGAAFHEAGHAIVASALGLAVYRIAIAIDGDDAKGEADIQHNPKLCLVDQIAICAAGMEAQKLYAAPTHEGAGWGDYGKMIELLQDLEDGESRKVRYEGHQRAYDLLVEHADRVEHLASELLAKKLLGPDELCNILERVSVDGTKRTMI